MIPINQDWSNKYEQNEIFNRYDAFYRLKVLVHCKFIAQLSRSLRSCRV